MKKILVISFSQTGQLSSILAQFLSPLVNAGHQIEHVNIRPKKPFPFPWDVFGFFNAMPETVLELPVELKEHNSPEKNFDMIVLGWQPWFLSPSLPVSTALKHPKIKNLIKNKPVVSVCGCRNMWINGFRSIKNHISGAGGKLVGNCVLSDKSNNLISAITIMHWLFKGKKTRKWGIFPLPGVNENDIDKTLEEGRLLNAAIETGNFSNLQNKIVALNKMHIPTNIWFIEARAKKLFIIWANLILKKGTSDKKRRFWVSFFKYYLIFALFVVSPIVLLIFSIFVRPFINKRINRQKKEFLNQLA